MRNKIIGFTLSSVLLVLSPMALSQLAPESSAAENAITERNHSIVLTNYLHDKEVVISNPLLMSAEEGGQYIPPIPGLLDYYLTLIAEGTGVFEAIMMTHASSITMDYIQKHSPEIYRKIQEMDFGIENE